MPNFCGALTNLAAYVAGELRFVWVDFPISENDFQQALNKIGNPEEYFWTDYEFPFDGMDFGEYASLSSLNEVAEFIDSLDSFDLPAFSAIIENRGDFEEAKKIYTSGDFQFYDDCNTETDLGYIIAENFEIPPHLEFYIDYERMGCDYDMNVNGGFTNAGYIEIF